MNPKRTGVLPLLCGIMLVMTAFPFFSDDTFYWMGQFVGYRVQKTIGAVLFLLPGVIMIFVAGMVHSEAKAAKKYVTATDGA